MVFFGDGDIKQKRCARCILPANYPGITFDEQEVCNFCLSARPRKYLGGEVLKRDIQAAARRSRRAGSRYDCLLGLSGGRDSSYLLHYLTKELGLKVLAFSADNGFFPEQTKVNIQRMVDRMKVDLVVKKHNHLTKVVRRHVRSWIEHPSAAMVGFLCVGCRLGIDRAALECAKKNGVPVIVSGGTPFEGKGYKFNLMRRDPNNRHSSLLSGYVSQIAANPRWVLSLRSLSTQLKEYYYHYKARGRKGVVGISPFYGYIRWEEDKILSTIERELDWKKDPRIASTWRGDCDIALLKLFLYKKTLGFNDKDDGLSCLVRDTQISREDALSRLEQEGDVSENLIRDILMAMNLDYTALERALSNLESGGQSGKG